MMQCIKCGTTIYTAVCSNCGFDWKHDSFLALEEGGRLTKFFDSFDETIGTEEKVKQKSEFQNSLKNPFLMPIEDVFQITGRGVVVTGMVQQGSVKTGDILDIIGFSKVKKQVTVTGIEMFQKTLTEAKKGDGVGILLSGVSKDEIMKGQELCTPVSRWVHTRFRAVIHLLTKAEGGKGIPIFNWYSPFLRFHFADIRCMVTLPKGMEMCLPGDNVEIIIELVNPMGMNQGQRFILHENGQKVAAGEVGEIME